MILSQSPPHSKQINFKSSMKHVVFSSQCSAEPCKITPVCPVGRSSRSQAPLMFPWRAALGWWQSCAPPAGQETTDMTMAAQGRSVLALNDNNAGCGLRCSPGEHFGSEGASTPGTSHAFLLPKDPLPQTCTSVTCRAVSLARTSGQGQPSDLLPREQALGRGNGSLPFAPCHGDFWLQRDLCRFFQRHRQVLVLGQGAALLLSTPGLRGGNRI